MVIKLTKRRVFRRDREHSAQPEPEPKRLSKKNMRLRASVCLLSLISVRIPGNHQTFIDLLLYDRFKSDRKNEKKNYHKVNTSHYHGRDLYGKSDCHGILVLLEINHR